VTFDQARLIRVVVVVCGPSSAEPRRCYITWPMTDLLQVLPNFNQKPYTHLLPSLDKALITTNDLLTLDAGDVAKRAQVPAGELRKLTDGVVAALHRQLGLGRSEAEAAGNEFLSSKEASATKERDTWARISTLDEKLDAALGGGIPRGYLVEITGERYCTYHHYHTNLLKLIHPPLSVARVKPNSS